MFHFDSNFSGTSRSGLTVSHIMELGTGHMNAPCNMENQKAFRSLSLQVVKYKNRNTCSLWEVGIPQNSKAYSLKKINST
jgi:hypothetical protein